MPNKRESSYFEIVFRLGMWWRIFYGVAKFALGLVLLYFVHSTFADIFFKFMRHEIIEDPNDILVNAIGSMLDKKDTSVSYFMAVYLIFWGLLDAFLSINLLKLRPWSYPVSLVLISAFTLYAMYRFTYTHSVILFLVIIIDLVIIWLISQEYGKLKAIER